MLTKTLVLLTDFFIGCLLLEGALGAPPAGELVLLLLMGLLPLSHPAEPTVLLADRAGGDIRGLAGETGGKSAGCVGLGPEGLLVDDEDDD